MTPREMSLKEYAYTLGVTVRTVRRWVAAGLVASERTPTGRIIRVAPRSESSVVMVTLNNLGSPDDATC